MTKETKKIWCFPGQLSVTVYPKATGVCAVECPGVHAKATRKEAANCIRAYRKAVSQLRRAQ